MLAKALAATGMCDGRRQIVSATMGAAAVGLGAFGAHGLEARLEALGRVEIWETAALYHLTHAVLLAAIAFSGRETGLWAWRLILIGVVVFSGSLYLLALTDVGVFGAITPIGGLSLIGGWIALALEAQRRARRGAPPRSDSDSASKTSGGAS